MLSNIGLAVCTLDSQGHVTTWNAGAAQFYAIEAKDVVGRHFSFLFDGDDCSQNLPAKALDVCQSEGHFEFDDWRICRSENASLTHGAISPIIDPAGQITGYVLASRNVPARREADAALWASEERFRLLVQSVTDYAIYMLDTDGRVSSWNAGAERFKGYVADDIIGQHFSRFYTDEDRKAEIPRLALDTVLRTGRFDAEGWRVRKDGSQFWASVIIKPVMNDSGALIGFAKVTRDLTEKRAVEEQLRQAQKMEAVGQLTGGLAHDFNNLLAGIGGSLEMMQMRLAQGRLAEFERYLVAAQGGVKRAAVLTHRLLAFSRRQTLDPKPIDIKKLLTGLEDLIRQAVGPSTTVDIAEVNDLWRTWIDAHQLENAILNLCLNGGYAMPSGGCLSIKAANQILDEQTARVQDLPAGDYVCLSVSDSGTGIPQDLLPKIFDPFFTTKPDGEGTGLGLSMIYGFVRQSGGQVRVDTEEGVGTTMHLYLPRYSQDVAERMAGVSCNSENSIGHGEVALVIDDEPIVRMLVSEVLEELGCQVVEACDAPSGLDILGSDVPITLLITDIGLPDGMDGRDVARAARLLHPDLKIVFITGYAESAVSGGESLDTGMSILIKPFDMDDLADHIRSVLAST